MSESPHQPTASSSRRSAWIARLLIVAGVNLALLLAVVLAGSFDGGLPEIDAETLGLGLLPVTAVMGLMLACRRLDLAAPAVFVMAVALRSNVFVHDHVGRLAGVVGICAGVGLLSALVTWYGRISSALWTALLALVLVTAVVPRIPSSFGPATLAPAWSLVASLGVLAVGGVLLGAGRLVVPPSKPPILATGSRGLAGLAVAWAIAGAGLALAAASETAGDVDVTDLEVFLAPLPGLALGGAYILRGRWGAVAAVVTTCLGHMVWSVTLASEALVDVDPAVAAVVPLAIVPLYLVLDGLVRHRTSESPPTGLLA